MRSHPTVIDRPGLGTMEQKSISFTGTSPVVFPQVSESGRGEIFAVFDAIRIGPRSMSAPQEMAYCLIRFFRDTEFCQPTLEDIHSLLLESNNDICKWRFIPGTDSPLVGCALGGCAGTVVWLIENRCRTTHRRGIRPDTPVE